MQDVSSSPWLEIWIPMQATTFGFNEDDSERGNDASEDRRIRQLVIGFERRI
jgi:hypothetical protein